MHQQRLRMSEQPKKLQNNKAKKLILNKKKSWQNIVNNVEKKEVPISVLQHISVQLIDGTNIIIDINELLETGQDLNEIEEMLDSKFNELDQYIKNVDFFVDVNKVQDTIQPETDKVLRGL